MDFASELEWDFSNDHHMMELEDDTIHGVRHDHTGSSDNLMLWNMIENPEVAGAASPFANSRFSNNESHSRQQSHSTDTFFLNGGESDSSPSKLDTAASIPPNVEVYQASPAATHDPETNMMLAYAQEVRKRVMAAQQMRMEQREEPIIPAAHTLERVIEDLRKSGAASRYSESELAQLQRLLSGSSISSRTPSVLSLAAKTVAQRGHPMQRGIMPIVTPAKIIPQSRQTSSKSPLQEASDYMEASLYQTQHDNVRFENVVVQGGIAWQYELDMNLS